MSTKNQLVVCEYVGDGVWSEKPIMNTTTTTQPSPLNVGDTIYYQWGSKYRLEKCTVLSVTEKHAEVKRGAVTVKIKRKSYFMYNNWCVNTVPREGYFFLETPELNKIFETQCEIEKFESLKDNFKKLPLETMSAINMLMALTSP